LLKKQPKENISSSITYNPLYKLDFALSDEWKSMKQYSLRKMVSLVSRVFATPGYAGLKCNCSSKGRCKTQRCPCRKKKQPCNSHCHMTDPKCHNKSNSMSIFLFINSFCLLSCYESIIFSPTDNIFFSCFFVIMR